MITDARSVEDAATALAAGAVVGHGFGNFYVITTRPDAETVRSVNLMKGRPPDQVGSITTTPVCIPFVYDWSRLPMQLTRHDVLGLMDALFGLGPFGFRGPAASHLPPHLTQMDEGILTAQVIAPGYACPSNAFLARAQSLCGEDILYITSANRSRHLSGAEDEPAHYKAEGLRAEFGHDPRFVVLEHADEALARRAYPLHAPMSTTILAFHKVAGIDRSGRPVLFVERHGSLHVDDVRRAVRPFGFDVTLGPHATRRLLERRYPPVQAAPASPLATAVEA